MVQALMEAGADATLRGFANSTPIFFAFERLGASEVVKTMIGFGADVNETAFSATAPLHLATDATTVGVLIEAGANIEARNATGAMALNANAATTVDIVRALVNHCCADVNTRGDNGSSPLHQAGRSGFLDDDKVFSPSFENIDGEAAYTAQGRCG